MMSIGRHHMAVALVSVMAAHALAATPAHAGALNLDSPATQEPAAATEAQQENTLLVEATERTVLLRWSLPDNAFPDGSFVIERTANDGSADTVSMPSPMARADAVQRGLIEDGEYAEFLRTFSRDDSLSPEESEARDLNRVVLTLVTFARPRWAEVLGTLHEDSTVTPGATYSYRVTTLVAGETVLVGEQEITVGEMDSLPTITGLVGEADGDGIKLRWELAQDGFIVGYKVYRTDPDGTEHSLTEDGVFVSQRADSVSGELTLPDVFLYDTEVEPNLTFSYSVVGFSIFGLETPRSDTVSIFFPDPDPLEVPMLTAVDIRDRAIELFWAAPADPRVASIGVVRTLDPIEEPTLLTPEYLAPSTTSYVDEGVDGGVSYYYALVTLDEHGQAFGPGSYWAARGINLVPPSAPQDLTLEPTEASLVLSWSASPEPDIQGYQLFIVRGEDTEERVLVTDDLVVETSHEFEVPPGTLDELRLVVRAVNTSFVEGAFSNLVSGRIIDTVPPDRPILNEIHSGEGVVSLSWAFTTDPDIAGYRVLRAVQGSGEEFTVVQGELSPDDISYTDRDVTPGLLHVYTVEAMDASGNVSEQAAPLAATPYRLTRPQAPQGVQATLLDEGGVQVQWESPDSGAGIIFHVVERATGGGRWVQVGDPVLAATPGLTDGTGRAGHVYRVVAIDAAGNLGLPSVEASVQEPEDG